MDEDQQRGRRTINLKLPEALIEQLDALKAEYGLRSRGAIVERLLHELLRPGDDGDSTPLDAERREAREDGGFDESGALVLVVREGHADPSSGLALRLERGDGQGDGTAAHPPQPPRGIDLPGFVRRQSDQVRRSLKRTPQSTNPSPDPVPPVSAGLLEESLERAHSHWLELYGKAADEAVLEAAMVWLAQDIWPQCDQSEGRPFSWSLVSDAMASLVPSWVSGVPSFERVVVAAGVLEDPFSASTLVVRIPTLIRRFVHRYRRRRGTPFQTLEHTMTVHGALKVLQLPTTPGQRLTLPQIREAYRQMALANHPDAGGSEEAMRRLNEAYQLLKELYRQPKG